MLAAYKQSLSSTCGAMLQSHSSASPVGPNILGCCASCGYQPASALPTHLCLTRNSSPQFPHNFSHEACIAKQPTSVCKNPQEVQGTKTGFLPTISDCNRAYPATALGIARHRPLCSHQRSTAAACCGTTHQSYAYSPLATCNVCNRTCFHDLTPSTRGGTGSGALPLYGSRCDTGTKNCLPVSGCSIAAVSFELEQYHRKW